MASGSEAEKAYIEVEGVSYTYPGGKAPALDGVSLAIRAGEFACILGPSGCGKSTLLQILSGLIVPQAGRVAIGGRYLWDGRRRLVSDLPRCGYVFQEARLLPWRTVRQNLELALKAAGFPRAEWGSIVERYLTMLRLDGYADAWPMNLSGGQRQRVAIARALAIDPAFLLMDEPFSTLDEVTARFLRMELLEIWRRTGKTVVFVTHSLREAAYLADRIYVMTRGPGRLFRVVDVPVSRPRRYEDPALSAFEGELLDVVLGCWGYYEGAGRAPENAFEHRSPVRTEAVREGT